MTLLICTIAACISTIVWYMCAPKSRKYYVGLLCLMYWGAAIMWMADAIMEYKEIRDKYFNPVYKEMINDTYLGFSVVALGIIIWLVVLLVKDPKGVVRGMIKKSDK